MRAKLSTALMSLYYSNSFFCIHSFLESSEDSCSMEPELLMVIVTVATAMLVLRQKYHG